MKPERKEQIDEVLLGVGVLVACIIVLWMVALFS